ncbi:MAG: hypothetical protein WA432_00455 [Candidatus Babeliaceae bacterium]
MERLMNAAMLFFLLFEVSSLFGMQQLAEEIVVAANAGNYVTVSAPDSKTESPLKPLTKTIATHHLDNNIVTVLDVLYKSNLRFVALTNYSEHNQKMHVAQLQQHFTLAHNIKQGTANQLKAVKFIIFLPTKYEEKDHLWHPDKQSLQRADTLVNFIKVNGNEFPIRYIPYVPLLTSDIRVEVSNDTVLYCLQEGDVKKTFYQDVLLPV